ncbi:cyanuric acid hydrolase/Barbiturase [Aspergillus multicolor]|uniref:cyanuric acid hydrolase/Barbiturase n=1 Tax=Aspergillus multicolor TaxID=41759 RepID=UPI003CCDB9D4
MAPINIFKYTTSSPADTTPLLRLEKEGHPASDVLAVIGKTEGNGCVNDFSRTLSAHAFEAPARIPASAVTVFSGGTEGVLSPHVTFLVRSRERTGLVACSAHTRPLAPQEVGTEVQSREVAGVIFALIADAGIPADAVRLVLVKCPLLTSADIEQVRAAAQVPITADTYHSMAFLRYASVLGIALSLGEITPGELAAGLGGELGAVWSPRASCSSGAELKRCHIMVLAADPQEAQGRLRATSGYMKDAMDAGVVLEMLDQIKAEDGKVEQVFVKAEADPSGSIRGLRHTMNTDSDIHSTRHARAAVGGLVAGLVGDSAVYVSGGGEGQGPPGGGSLCIVYSV